MSTSLAELRNTIAEQTEAYLQAGGIVTCYQAGRSRGERFYDVKPRHTISEEQRRYPTQFVMSKQTREEW